jgi:long-chain acyl-CoA synthetase
MQVTRKPSDNFTRLFDVLAYQLAKYPNEKALNESVNGLWKGYSIQEIIQRVNHLSCWFIRNEYTRGQKIILAPVTGSPAWMIIDFACQQVGLVTVPIHSNSTSSDFDLIISETESSLCIAADRSIYDAIIASVERTQSTARTYHLDSTREGYFEALNEKESNNELEKLASLKESISPDDLVTILYTSGSSGTPKGVMLSHNNIAFNIKAVLMLLPLEPHYRVLSFLPFSHILERMACYSYLAFGVSLYFNSSKETFVDDFKTVRPHFCTSVPRVLEKMYDFMLEQMVKRNFVQRNTIRWALNVGKQYSSGKIRFIYLLKLTIARWLVLGQWRKKLGGKIRHMVVGAASLRPEIGKLFSAAGIQIIEGYGMTETAPLIAVNRFEPGLNMFGTVGLIVPGVDVKIDSPSETGEGEILVKGPNLTQGYFKRQELNSEVFTSEGWFKTGDVGMFVKGRFLKITDRKKDIFKTSAGKYIAPQPLQNHFNKSPFIQRCLIIGFQKPFVTALLVPHFEILQAWCLQEGIHWTSPQFMVYNIKVRARMQQEIDTLNEVLPNIERIKDFVLCHQDWTLESGELTPTLKPIRLRIMDHYKSEIEKMYG